MTQRDLEKKFLSRKLSTATAEDLKNEAFRRKIVESSIEIRELESKLKMAYILKERKKQLDEKESIRVMEKVMTLQEREETEKQLKLDHELEIRKLLYEKWKKEKYCQELVKQAEQYRAAKQLELMKERKLDDMYLQEILMAELRRERQEREDRERKKRRLAEELDNCIRLQNQWKAIQKLIEMEEDRLIEECQVQRRRLSHMQQQERKEKADKLAAIRQQLQKALEVEERRRREREELWVEYGCEEREDLETKKAAELEKMTQAQRIKWNEDMTEQLRLLELKKKAMKEEELNERLWMLEQAALEEQAEREAADKRHKDLTQLQKEQAALLEERRQQRKLEFAEKEEERRREEMRQQAEDQAIAEERRRILEQHAPLLIGFMPPGVFRDMAEIRSLPENVQAQFRRHVRIQDDPDLW
ncbi:meiosis-specific nuclear structural protein 1-like [Daphnia pulex]|uniref:meiosis-specific nuclear structural protein 1-like n=1 Tax=Daphnia pulex TaxID=6669 RepID=UPI001EDDD42C|nr:meiosis-specific nuclear structural protein 1-like [Daphnia pulex]XP_046460488.1 meiosis-specific nuclear structural protein 1-like [Daphnia pulex]XP_046460489.1 meiosis-specific nuclear structural protein 1-like [Daphnia pulex]XP_046460490.1 meiosis-specific nuclear structural protein 1-like [Daphnia pulex]XP_046460492.1 meiosis-specific nuclear structural protein 1-like [Daphnia pulex]XP_046460493.1 meiosis-specific nuclear structural protein 1-like [Daphnia pulex]XP_046633815.1 meiosis-